MKVGDVIHARGVKINVFRDRYTLSTKHASFFLDVNPQLAEANALRGWYRTVGENIDLHKSVESEEWLSGRLTEPGWRAQLRSEFKKPYFQSLAQYIKEELRQDHAVYPPQVRWRYCSCCWLMLCRQ